MKINLKFNGLLALAIIIGSSSLAIANSKQDFQVYSLRQRSMGNVGTAVMFDEMALMHNPAGLAYSKFDVDIARLGVAFGQDGIDKFNDFKALKDTEDDDGAMAEAIRDLVPTNIDATFTFAPLFSMTAPGFGIGAFSQSQIHARLRQKVNPLITVEAMSDSAPAIGLAHEFDIWGPTAIGFSVKAPFRGRLYDKSTGETDFELDLTEMMQYISDDGDKKEPGFMMLNGVAFDLGMLRKFDSYKYGKGMYGLSVRNIGGSLQGDQDITTETGDTYKRTYKEELPIVSTLGFSYEAPLSRIPRVGPLLGDVLIAGDWKFMSEYGDYKRNINLGIEKKLWIFKLRGGVNQGYIVGGLGMDIKFWIFDLVHLDYANYTQEYGQDLGDRPIQYQALEVQFLF